MAKTAPKGKGIAAKATQNKAEKPVAPKAAKTAVKPAAGKEAKQSGKTAAVAGKAAAPAAKKAPTKGSKKTAKKVNRGDQYYCGVCGLIVSVDEACGCAEACDIICCGEEMKARK